MSDIGGWVSERFGSKNKTKATAPQIDPNAYQYGGNPGGAQEAAERYRAMGQGAQGRGAEATNLGMANVDRDQAYAARNLDLQAREGQQAAARSSLARAMGYTPSIAGMQAQQDMTRAIAAQGSQAASARGAAGIALAQQTAANNIANASGQISNQAQINAANERLAAEQAAGQAFGQMRAGDVNTRSGDQQQQNLTQDVAKYDAGLRAQQRQQNDAFQMGMTGFETGVRGQQLAASMNQQAQQSANAMGAQGINAGVAGQNAAMNQSNAWGVVGALQSAGGAAAGALGKAEGGAVQPGQPYVVGERGPELIVPRENGVVIPNHALGRSPGINPNLSPAGIVNARYNPRDEERRATAARLDADRDARLDVAPPTNVLASRMVVADGMQRLHDQDVDRATTARAYDEAGIERSERDQYEDDRAERRLAHERRGRRPGAATLASRLSAGGDDLIRQAGRVDTSYHAPHGYIPPQLIQISGARAGGGPVGAGGGYLVGEQGPELMVPGVPVPGASATQFGPGSGGSLNNTGPIHQRAFGQTPSAAAYGPGQAVASTSFAGSGGLLGGSVAGEDAAHKAFGVRFARNATAYGDADGGPVRAGENHVVGERGPEVVVPIGNPIPGVNLHIGDDGRAFYQHDIEVDDGRPRIESRSGSSGASGSSKGIADFVIAATSKPKAKAAAKPRKMTDEELLREADRQIAAIKATEAASMAAGPAVRMPVKIDRVAPSYVVSTEPQPSYVAPPIASTLPPPKPPPVPASYSPAELVNAMSQARRRKTTGAVHAPASRHR